MGDLDAHWWWLLAAALLALVEIMLPGVFSIWVAGAAALTALAVWAFDLTFSFQLALFALLAIASVYGGRRWYEHNPGESPDPLLNDRAARLIGRTVEVVDPIKGGEGRVRVGDGVWPARGADAEAGSHVRVVGADGGCLKVEPERLIGNTRADGET